MESLKQEAKPHPQFLDVLFAHKRTVSKVFSDVLGLHEIHHIAITYVDQHSKLLTFSSTPALEFNLFNRSLWRYDQTYHMHWVERLSQTVWQNLYTPSRYDELYYLKQTKYGYALGVSMAAKIDECHLIYSIASRKPDEAVKASFTEKPEHLYRIGQYCTQHLIGLFHDYESVSA